MGLSDHFLAVRTAGELPAHEEVDPLGRHGEWVFARLGRVAPEKIASSLASELGAPAITALVIDSDWACMYFAEPSGDVDFLTINEAYPEIEPTVFREQLDRRWTDETEHAAAAASLAVWAGRHAPASPTAEEIVAALADPSLRSDADRRELLFAEEGLRVVLTDLLGLPSLDDAVFTA